MTLSFGKYLHDPRLAGPGAFCSQEKVYIPMMAKTSSLTASQKLGSPRCPRLPTLWHGYTLWTKPQGSSGSELPGGDGSPTVTVDDRNPA